MRQTSHETRQAGEARRPLPVATSPVRFSLERALATWLIAIGIGLLLTLVVLGFQALPHGMISEAGAAGTLLGIGGALVAILSTMPLALFVDVGSHLEYLVLPNALLVGLVIAGIRGWTR
jgi:hypothetical protein